MDSSNMNIHDYYHRVARRKSYFWTILFACLLILALVFLLAAIILINQNEGKLFSGGFMNSIVGLFMGSVAACIFIFIFPFTRWDRQCQFFSLILDFRKNEKYSEVVFVPFRLRMKFKDIDLEGEDLMTAKILNEKLLRKDP